MSANARALPPPAPWWLRWPGAAVVAAGAISYRVCEGDLAQLTSARARDAVAGFVGGFWPPAHSTEFLSSLVRPALETLGIAYAGMTLALFVAAPLSFLAASPRVFVTGGDQPTRLHMALHHGVRALLSFMRAIPELLWALLFVRAAGLGAMPGVLAVGIAYAGVVGKVFAEIYESVPRGPAVALATAGATPVRAFAFGVFPQAMPLMTSYTLYRLDCAVRASAVLGLVGAGGLGQQADVALRMFQYDETATIMLVLFGLVAALDGVSFLVRRRLERSRGLFPHGRVALRNRCLAVVGGTAAFGATLQALDAPLWEMLLPSSVTHVAEFAAGMLPPDLGELGKVGTALVETLAISVFGTLLAAALAMALAYPASRKLFLQELGDEAAKRFMVRWQLRRVVHSVARGVLNLGRTVPETLWALLLIFAVGLGPFAGALALALHTAGVLGRLYAEALEEVDLGPARAMMNTGVRPGLAVLAAVLPQAFTQLIAFTLYRWEVNVRASAVLGLVGGGGLGAQLHVALGLFQYPQAMTLILGLLVLVLAVEQLSARLRRALGSGGQGPRAAVAAW
ncbi:MAG: phosphonate ABC transporter, permease protein PhnE [Myxococcota bacterium]